MVGKISAREMARRLQKLEEEGTFSLSDRAVGEIVTIHTDPATYKLEIVTPGFSHVRITSLQDLEFEKPLLCNFLGSSWDDVSISNWKRPDASMIIEKHFARDCYPQFKFFADRFRLPAVRQIEVNGKPFFANEDQ